MAASGEQRIAWTLLYAGALTAGMSSHFLHTFPRFFQARLLQSRISTVRGVCRYFIMPCMPQCICTVDAWVAL